MATLPSKPLGNRLWLCYKTISRLVESETKEGEANRIVIEWAKKAVKGALVSKYGTRKEGDLF
jgi:hypothetical protein